MNKISSSLHRSNRKTEADKLRGVYVVAPGPAGPSKIGVAYNFLQRLKGLQSGNWEALRPYDFEYYAPSSLDTAERVMTSIAGGYEMAFALENASHRALTEMGFHISGEWFDVGAKDAADVVRKCAEKMDFAPIEWGAVQRRFDFDLPEMRAFFKKSVVLKMMVANYRFMDENRGKNVTDSR